MEQNVAFMTSPIGDLPINTDGLLKAVDEIARLNRVQAELQELNMKYYNEAKDCKREIAKLAEENKNLKQSLENDFTFETTNGGKMNVLDMVKQQAVKEFAEKLDYYIYDLPNNTQMKGIKTNAINDLLKEYGVEL